MKRYALFYDSKEDMQHISANSKGGWVRYDDAQAEIDRLTAALAQEKATSALMFKDTADIVAKLHSERDQALALAAAAAMEMRKRAAGVAAERWAYLHDDDDRKGPVAAAVILSLSIDPDAQKALDKMLAKAREDGIRLSASIAEAWKTFDGEDYRPVEAVILALLNDGGRDE